MVWNKFGWSKLVILLAALGVYAFVVYSSLRESGDQSLQLIDETTEANRVLVRVTVTSVTPATRQLTAQLAFRFAGTISQDEVTPRVSLRLLVNNVGAQQAFDFHKGKRIYRIDATFPLDGDVNRYPLDRYQAHLLFLVTTPRQGNEQVKPEVVQPKRRGPHTARKKPEESVNTTALAVGETALQGNVPVPLSISLLASVPQIKFSGHVSRPGDSEPTEVVLDMKRPNRVIRISVTVMILMMILALSVLAMAIKAINPQKKFDLLPLSLSLSLIFGLPALRDIQPGIPPVGVFGDNLSFTWAEVLVAASAIIIMWTWLLRSDPN
jgi:hypothetical protein